MATLYHQNRIVWSQILPLYILYTAFEVDELSVETIAAQNIKSWTE